MLTLRVLEIIENKSYNNLPSLGLSDDDFPPKRVLENHLVSIHIEFVLFRVTPGYHFNNRFASIWSVPELVALGDMCRIIIFPSHD